jgi:glutaredoxin
VIGVNGHNFGRGLTPQGHFIQNFVSAEISLVVCDTCKKVQAIFDRYEETPNLKTIVLIEKMTVELQNKAQQLGVKLISFTQLEVKLG